MVRTAIVLASSAGVLLAAALAAWALWPDDESVPQATVALDRPVGEAQPAPALAPIPAPADVEETPPAPALFADPGEAPAPPPEAATGNDADAGSDAAPPPAVRSDEQDMADAGEGPNFAVEGPRIAAPSASGPDRARVDTPRADAMQPRPRASEAPEPANPDAANPEAASAPDAVDDAVDIAQTETAALQPARDAIQSRRPDPSADAASGAADAEADDASGRAGGAVNAAAGDASPQAGEVEETRRTVAALSPEAAGPAEPTPADAEEAPAAASTGVPLSQPDAAPDVRRPSFDAVRVGAYGDLFVAGRSEPGAEITVLADGEVVGRETADARGDWVFTGAAPLRPGPHELTLSARGGGDGAVASEEAVVLVIPDEEAGSGLENRAVALLTRRDELAASELLQAPEGPLLEPAAGPPAGPPEAADAAAETPPLAAPAAAETGAGGRETVEVARRSDAAAAIPAAAPPAEEGAAAAADEVSRDDMAPDGPSADGRTPGMIAGPVTEPAPQAGPQVSVGVIDYDEAGRVIVSGQAADPFARVRLYLDNLPVGTAIADAAGAFRALLDDTVSPGLYSLRVDSLDEAGGVAARAEMPFERADIEVDPDGRRVIIQPGNNLWTIARFIYGSGFRYTAIYQANRDQIRDPDLIYPGQVFSLPDGGESPRDG